MLKDIPCIITPELLKILDEMGHGDEIVVCDANCPAHSYVKNCIYCSVTNAPSLVGAILTLIPLDTYQKPVYLMEKFDGDTTQTDIWQDYDKVIKTHTNEKIEHIERFKFYEHMTNAYAAVITSDIRSYGNIILKKGVFE